MDEICLSAEELGGLLKEALSKNACVRFSAKGSSMRPFIKDADVLTIAPLSAGLPKVGNIVAFTGLPANKLVVHRVIKKSPDAYFIKGDSNCRGVSAASRADILGVVTRIERNGKRVTLGLGAEKRVIAFLSRSNLLPAVFRAWQLIPRSLRYPIKRSLRA